MMHIFLMTDIVASDESVASHFSVNAFQDTKMSSMNPSALYFILKRREIIDC